ncbi:MAG: hypothetical protein CVV27_07225 [Candidatus Melainabacteria bacterium HGW-Melainabacteria-1]|nr:MAG: hypothetical protein CVV27_07225 [Candidatus Melainabacteria bacterium HGW-Melainabacteria-1]
MKVLLEGNLAYVSLFNLLQFIKLEQKHSLLHTKVKEVAQESKVYFERGRIVYAELNQLRGADAMYRLIGWWDYGNFQFLEVPQDELPTDNIKESLDAILMESARYLDEFVDIRQQCPNLTSGLAFSSKALQMVEGNQLPEFCRSLPRSFTVARFFETCPYTQWDALVFLREMFKYQALISADKLGDEEMRTTNRLTPIDSLESIVMEFVGIDDSHRFVEEVLTEKGYARNHNFGFSQMLGLADALIDKMKSSLRDDDELQEVTYRLRARITSLL